MHGMILRLFGPQVTNSAGQHHRWRYNTSDLKTIRAFTRPEVPSSLSVLTDLLTTAVDDSRCSWTAQPRMAPRSRLIRQPETDLDCRILLRIL